MKGEGKRKVVYSGRKKERTKKKSQKDEMVVVHSDLDYRAMTNDDGRKML